LVKTNFINYVFSSEEDILPTIFYVFCVVFTYISFVWRKISFILFAVVPGQRYGLKERNTSGSFNSKFSLPVTASVEVNHMGVHCSHLIFSYSFQ
jgi:hypothetical protein